MNENPNSADRLRQDLNKRIRSWFGPDPEESDRKVSPSPVVINLNAFRDPAERRAAIEGLKDAGIPFITKYE
jgi:hypothetical protein